LKATNGSIEYTKGLTGLNSVCLRLKYMMPINMMCPIQPMILSPDFRTIPEIRNTIENQNPKNK
jgi:hypothetical protein